MPTPRKRKSRRCGPWWSTTSPGSRLRYLDGTSGQWTDDWDSTQAGTTERQLPIAVEIALYLYDDDGAVHDYSTIVDLPLATRPTPTPAP